MSRELYISRNARSLCVIVAWVEYIWNFVEKHKPVAVMDIDFNTLVVSVTGSDNDSVMEFHERITSMVKSIEEVTDAG